LWEGGRPASWILGRSVCDEDAEREVRGRKSRAGSGSILMLSPCSLSRGFLARGWLLSDVDTVCINQNDSAERSHQVAYMREIYTTAKLVIVWLGTNGIREDTDALGEVSEIRRYIEVVGEESLSRGCTVQEVPADAILGRLESDPNPLLDELPEPVGHAYGLEPSIEKRQLSPFIREYVISIAESQTSPPDVVMQTFLKVSRFFSHPWFRRIWVLQEVGLQPWCDSLSCGKTSLLASARSCQPFLSWCVQCLSRIETTLLARCMRRNHDQA
jgi:hypothetical protein